MPSEHPNLIRLFDFYLAATLVISLVRRYRLYWDTAVLAFGFYGRWPKLVERLRLHHGVLLTADMLRPLIAAIVLTIVQFVCSRLVWPTATLPTDHVFSHSELWIPIILAAVPMVLIDLYFLVRVGRFDRDSTEGYLDYAEHWLASWKTPVVRLATLGYVNPQRIVDAEVVKGLESVGRMVGWASRWAAIQLACRVLFGLVMWLAWAFGS